MITEFTLQILWNVQSITVVVGKIVTTTLEASTVPAMRAINLDKTDFLASVRNNA